MKITKTFYKFGFIGSLMLLSASVAFPCSTLFLQNSADRVVAKNLDWPYRQGLIYINKRHVQKTAIYVTPPEKPLSWVSKYMSVTFTQTGREFPWEGMNEAGLSVDIMMLPPMTAPNPRDVRPGVNVLQWIQFILDTSANVPEAIANARRVLIAGPFPVNEHYFVCDAAGRCATFEYLNAKLIVHGGATLPYYALTNNIYSESAVYAANQVKTRSLADIMNSTSVTSLDRFTRAALWASHFTSGSDEMAYAFHALDNVHQPGLTQWSIAWSLAPREIHWKTMWWNQIRSFKLSSFDPRCSAPVKIFDINANAQGDVTRSFQNFTDAANAALVNSSTLEPQVKPAVTRYPSTTKCLD